MSSCPICGHVWAIADGGIFVEQKICPSCKGAQRETGTLQGKFDPKLLTAPMLQAILRDVLIDALSFSGDLRMLAVAQNLLDELIARKIIQ